MDKINEIKKESVGKKAGVGGFEETKLVFKKKKKKHPLFPKPLSPKHTNAYGLIHRVGLIHNVAI